MVASKDNYHWSNIKEVGSLLGFKCLLLVYRLFGRGVFSVVLYPVVIYFVCVHTTQRRASLQYLRQVHRFAPGIFRRRPQLLHTLRHYMNFAHAVLDKLLAWCTELSDQDFILQRPEEVKKLMQDQRGQLIIGSHFGNLEFCRGFLLRYKPKVINVLLYDKHATSYVKMMAKINPKSRVNVYQVTELNLNTILNLKRKISDGEWLFIAGDRIPLSNRQHTLAVEFMGKPAEFPTGPYLLAKTLECPVTLMFAYKKNRKTYFDVQPFSDKIVLPRGSRQHDLRTHVQRFATVLQQCCLQAPYQWFNFYPFWSTATERDHAPRP